LTLDTRRFKVNERFYIPVTTPKSIKALKDDTVPSSVDKARRQLQISDRGNRNTLNFNVALNFGSQ